jgi:hypothetical protein
MDVAIVAALIGAVGSVVATVIGALIAQRLSPTPGQRGDARTPGGQAVIVPPVPPRLGIVPLFCIASGSFLALTGMALFGYVVVALIVTIWKALQAGTTGPPDLSGIPFATFVPLGIGLAFAGMVVLWIGILVAGFRTFGKRAA